MKAAHKALKNIPHPLAHSLLDDEAKESWRVFISTFVQHSTATHLALGDMLALRFGAVSATPDWTKVRQRALVPEFGSGVEKFAVTYYASTQALLAMRNDEPTVELFRGVARHTAEVLLKDLARPGYEPFLNLNPLSSWATDIKLAERFARRGGGLVVRMDLPKNMVFAIYGFDQLMQHLLERQIAQHMKGGIGEFGGEAIVWCPLSCLPVSQEDIIRDYTQVGPAKTLGND